MSADPRPPPEELVIVATAATERLAGVSPVDSEGVPKYMFILVVVPFSQPAKHFLFSAVPAMFAGDELVTVLSGLVDSASEARVCAKKYPEERH